MIIFLISVLGLGLVVLLGLGIERITRPQRTPAPQPSRIDELHADYVADRISLEMFEMLVGEQLAGRGLAPRTTPHRHPYNAAMKERWQQPITDVPSKVLYIEQQMADITGIREATQAAREDLDWMQRAEDGMLT